MPTEAPDRCKFCLQVNEAIGLEPHANNIYTFKREVMSNRRTERKTVPSGYNYDQTDLHTRFY